jgi:hypothetical protein
VSYYLALMQTNIYLECKHGYISAVAYINNMGGMTSQSMDQLAIEIWNWCTDHHLFISAQYLPGVLKSNAGFNGF